MFEIEKRYLFNLDVIKRLDEICSFTNCDTLINEYFDFPDFSLIQKDIRLRKRQGKWQLKYPIRSGYDVHKEVDNIDEIESICGSLQKVKKVVTLTTYRKEVMFKEVNISIDSVISDNGIKYEVIEFEKTTNSTDMIDQMLYDLKDFERNYLYDIKLIPTLPKLIYYLNS